MRIPSLFAVWFCATLSVLPAQKGTEGSQETIQKEIESMRKQIQHGSLVRINVTVSVRLKNQNKINGVVKNGRFIEKPQGLEFVQADRETRGAGIRVWYYDGTASCIFLPYDDIESATIGKRLTESQVRDIEHKLETEQKKSDDLRERARREREEAAATGKGEKAEEKGEDDKKPAAADTKADEQKKKLLALVDEFPPAKGWNPEKAADLERRKVVLHVFPSAEEKRFLEVLEDWKKGMALKSELEGAKKDSEGKGEPKAESRPEGKLVSPPK